MSEGTKQRHEVGGKSTPLKSIRKTNDFYTSWEARIALGSSWIALKTSWDGLGPLLGALGHLLRDLGSLLGDLGSVLGDLDSVLGRSWGLLARSWVVLGVQESPGQGASVARATLSADFALPLREGRGS